MNRLTFFLPKKLNFGSYLILIMEIKYLEIDLKFKNINFIFYSKNFNKPQFNLFSKILNNLNLGIKCTSFRYRSIFSIKNDYFDYSKLINKNSTYSLQSINLYYAYTKKKPIFIYKSILKKRVDKYIFKNQLNKFITIHLKHDPNNKLAHANYTNWNKAFKKIKLKKKLFIFMVGNPNANKYFEEPIKNLIFCKNNFSLSEEMYLVSISKYFIGTASGFCCAANFSKVSYSIIKHPDHHKELIKDELDGKKIPFSNKNQNILFVKQSVSNIVKILNNI